MTVGEPLRGFRVGVTSHRRAEDLVAALQLGGAQVLFAPVLTRAARADAAPVSPPSTDRLVRLIDATCRHEVDAVAFSSAAAVHAVLAAAGERGRLLQFLAVLRADVLTAAAGRATAAPLAEIGLSPLVPERARPEGLVRLVGDELERQHVIRLGSDGVEVQLRGRRVELRPLAQEAGHRTGVGPEGRSVLLSPSALALFRRLVASSSVVSREELLCCLPDGGEDHALEVAMSRLRCALDQPGLITTVVRRGYRLNAHRLVDPEAHRSGPGANSD